MNRAIEYFYWLNSDWALLGADRLKELAHRHDVQVNYKPIDLPHVYSRTGGVLLSQRSPERQAYRVAELKRWCRKLDFELNVTPKYMCPNADLASCLVIAAGHHGHEVHALSNAILRAEWCEERDVSSAEVLRSIASSLQLPTDDLMDLARHDATVATYRRNTEEAISYGVFGSPSYVFEGELFWGQDRLDMLGEAIEASKTSS